MLRTVLALLLMTLPAQAEGERAGDFDYYVMSLSWTPTWCNLTGDARHSPQCKSGRGFGRNTQMAAISAFAEQPRATRHG